jgi:hypothetical protein
VRLFTAEDLLSIHQVHGLRLANCHILRRSGIDKIDMKAKFRFKQAIASSAVFALIVLTLVALDARVRERFHELLASGDTIGSWSDRAAFMGEAVLSAARHQSLENAPLVVFAAVGAVLFLFMVRT